MSVTVIETQAVSKQFLLAHNASSELKVRFLGLLHSSKRQSVEEFWALRNVSMTIAHGESVGLVGRNGSGKSTLLKLMAGIHRPTEGRVLVARRARIASMIELGVGFHPELTGRENVFLSAAIHGLTRPEIERIFADVVDYSGLEHFIDVPIKNYSSGMHMRLGFAISANLDPDILLLDEIFAVGDADFQQKCTGTINRFMDEGKTILFVSHAAAAVRKICRRVAVLDQGRLNFDGPVEEGLAFYEATLMRRAALGDGGQAKAGTPGAPGNAAVLTEADLDFTPHRLASGGQWTWVGNWVFEFLRSQGLRPEHYVLDVGCGSLTAAVHLVPYLQPGHYWGLERDSALVQAGLDLELPRAGVDAEQVQLLVSDTFQLDGTPHQFDVAFASSLFPYLTFNAVAMCIAGVVRKLAPGGRFYATWFENPDASDLQPIMRPGGGATHPDRVPFHYPFALVEHVCVSVGARVERVAGALHPRGEAVIVISRTSTLQ